MIENDCKCTTKEDASKRKNKTQSRKTLLCNCIKMTSDFFLQWIQSALLFLSVEESILVNSKLLFIANDGGNIGNKKDYSAHQCILSKFRVKLC